MMPYHQLHHFRAARRRILPNPYARGFGTSPEYLYVLELEHGKFYVGKSVNVQARFQEHVNGFGSAFTAKYRPNKIIEVLECTSPFDEDNLVRMYMVEHGIENVRGGSYCLEILPEEDRLRLLKEMRHAHGLCMRCGRGTHFATSCFAHTDVDGTPLSPRNSGVSPRRAVSPTSSPSPSMSQPARSAAAPGPRDEGTRRSPLGQGTRRQPRRGLKPSTLFSIPCPSDPREGGVAGAESPLDCCGRCGRNSHVSAQCYARVDIAGNPLDSPDTSPQSPQEHHQSSFSASKGRASPVKEEAGRESLSQESLLALRTSGRRLSQEDTDSPADVESRRKQPRQSHSHSHLRSQSLPLSRSRSRSRDRRTGRRKLPKFRSDFRRYRNNVEPKDIFPQFRWGDTSSGSSAIQHQRSTAPVHGPPLSAPTALSDAELQAIIRMVEEVEASQPQPQPQEQQEQVMEDSVAVDSIPDALMVNVLEEYEESRRLSDIDDGALLAAVAEFERSHILSQTSAHAWHCH